ncbi:ribosome rescue protein RqcH [Geoglobus acetivorans]|uniref:RNA-binding protein homologous to eukaryotic snRNP n=1 Tax=Geoglobus acetivorans TaxID=565033 RepID=A0A0A7GFY4_GEOAI|nr:RNA-binding protein homologous to eukaryotic snRNP [Geoglobus acetivorans]
MRSMSSLDISIVIEEIREMLIGARVDKIYHYPPDEIRIKLRGKQRVDLTIQAGIRVHPTLFPKESPRFPSSFAMLLRKHLDNARVVDIKQHDFDRVVVLTFQREERKHIIAELFSKGNVILADENFRVIMPLKHEIKIGSTYSFPEPRPSPREVREVEDFRKIIDGREVVRTIARRLGTGGLYAEEILRRAGVDKTKKSDELEDDEIRRIIRAMHEIYMPGKIKPHIVLDEGKYLDYQPVELLAYDKYDKKYFEEYWKAIDDFFSSKTVESVEQQEKRNEVLEKLERRYREQKEAKERFEREMEKFRRIGDLIYENYQKMEAIHSSFRKAVESRGWKEVMKIVEEQKKNGKLKEIVALIPEENAVDVELEGHTIRLWLRKSIHEIADEYYSRAKKFREKLEGVTKALKKTEDEMKKAENLEEKRILSSIRIARKREWYEKYRWYITSEGFLVIGGRSADMNEEIVSKHLESRDLFFHTEMPGGAATILKKGQDAGEKSIEEAAEFAAIYSALWKEGKHAGEVYYVRPEQVKKAARPGEYLPKGSFFIEGKRNYTTVELKMAVGVDLSNLRLFGGPVDGVMQNCDYYVVLEIGDLSVNEMQTLLARKLVEMAKDDEKHVVRAIASPDEIAKFLPPGRSRIAEPK